MVKSIVALFFLTSVALLASELDVSQLEGQSYEIVKATLTSQGWDSLPKQVDEMSLTETYPEITCGSGSMAICSVGFRKDNRSIALIVTKSDRELIVIGEY